MESGAGAIGVEFAGTAVTSTGNRGPIEPTAGDAARGMIRRNEEMFWQEGYYRGYFVLSITPEKIDAEFFGEQIPICESQCFANAHLTRLSICRNTQRLGYTSC